MTPKIFTYDEALELMPEIERLTREAVARVEELDDEDLPEHQAVVEEWARAVMALGLEVKGLWLVDFDSGSGYYCWRYPEPALEHYHDYQEGFSGRVKLQ